MAKENKTFDRERCENIEKSMIILTVEIGINYGYFSFETLYLAPGIFI